MNISYFTLLFCFISYVYGSDESGVRDGDQDDSLAPVEDPVASTPEAQQFREAVDGGNMDAAKKIYVRGSDQLKKCCGKYMASLEVPKLIELFKNAGWDVMIWMLEMLLVYASISICDAVINT